MRSKMCFHFGSPSSPSRTGLSLWRACKLLRWSPSISPWSCSPGIHLSRAYLLLPCLPRTRISTFSARSVLASYIGFARRLGLTRMLLNCRSDSTIPDRCSRRFVPDEPSLCSVATPRFSTLRVEKLSRHCFAQPLRPFGPPCSAVPATGCRTHPSTQTTTSTFPLHLLPCSSCPNSGQTAHISHTSCTVNFLSYQAEAAPGRDHCHRAPQSSSAKSASSSSSPFRRRRRCIGSAVSETFTRVEP